MLSMAWKMGMSWGALTAPWVGFDSAGSQRPRSGYSTGITHSEVPSRCPDKLMSLCFRVCVTVSRRRATKPECMDGERTHYDWVYGRLAVEEWRKLMQSRSWERSQVSPIRTLGRYFARRAYWDESEWQEGDQEPAPPGAPVP